MGRQRQTEVQLTDRQREVLRLVAKGHTNAEIADALGISLAGAKWHVSDLLGRFDVETRDELAEQWTSRQRPGARLHRWMNGLVAGLAFKPGVLAATAGAAVVVGVGAAVGIAAIGGDDSETPLAAAVTVVPSPTPVPAATLPASPGAVWTPDEALRRAEAVAQGEMDGRAHMFATPLAIDDLPLVSASWNPGVEHYDSPNGDNYWDRSDGPRNAWGFMWKLDGVEATDLGFARGTLEVEVLIGDGKEALAHRTLFEDPSNPQPYGRRGSGFQSKADLQYIRNEREKQKPAGPFVTFGWHNGLVGSLPLDAYASAAGYWCVRGSNADGTVGAGITCKPEADTPTFSVDYSHGGLAPQTGGLEDAFVWANTDPNIVSLGIRKQGQETRYPTYPPPVESGITRRFAWLGIGSVSPEGFEVVGYDASGAAVWSRASEPVRPPPPPPPTPVR